MAKMAIFGCFRQNIGISLIEYEGLGPETCTKPVGIPGEAFYVVFGPQIRFFYVWKGKKWQKWPFLAVFGQLWAYFS